MKKFKTTHNKTKRVKKTLASKLTKAQKRTLYRRALKKSGRLKKTTSPIKYTVTVLDDRNTLTKAQIKRALNRVALITFVNKTCNKQFMEYTEVMDFIRSACASDLGSASHLKAKAEVKTEKIIQLSADKTDGAKVITFKEKMITKEAALKGGTI